MPPQEISDFRPSEIVYEALFEPTEVRTTPWRNQHAPCSFVRGATLSREGVAPRGACSACSLKSGPVKTGPTGLLATALSDRQEDVTTS